MPRLPRLDAPGVLHHVIIRGIEQRDIFKDDNDRDNLLERLNPLGSGIVSDLNTLAKYKYYSHAALMEKRTCEWIDTEYVLSCFGKTVARARNKYQSYLNAGVELGSRPELVGGDLIQNLGGWEEVRKMKIGGQERVKGEPEHEIIADSILAPCGNGGNRQDSRNRS